MCQAKSQAVGIPPTPAEQGGKGTHDQSHGQTPKQQQSTISPAQHTRNKTTGTVPASAISTAGDRKKDREDKTASKAAVTVAQPAANDDGYVCIRVPKEKIAPVDTGLIETVPHHVSQSAGPQNTAPVLDSIPVQLPAPTSQQWRGGSNTLSYPRVSVGSGDTWIRWAQKRNWPR